MLERRERSLRDAESLFYNLWVMEQGFQERKLGAAPRCLNQGGPVDGRE